MVHTRIWDIKWIAFSKMDSTAQNFL